MAPDLTQGIAALIQCCGVGAVRPNMVLFGWNTDPERRAVFEESLCTVVRLGRSMAILRCLEPPEDIWAVRPGSIDVWWQGKGANGHLMLLLAHLLCGNALTGRRIRIIRMLPTPVGREEVLAHLQELSEEVRIPCEGVVVIGDSFAEVLSKQSASASLVMLGIPDPREQEAGFAAHWESQVADLPNVLFVYSAGDMSLHA